MQSLQVQQEALLSRVQTARVHHAQTHDVVLAVVFPLSKLIGLSANQLLHDQKWNFCVCEL